ncbi:hypothetical protein TRFO_16184 [Tritrichomonas foetus]|uniref:Uncharacterized protein n=1 Tax=Tritrichomonas foetus TaxID=1144522 RepID=A0A1J4KRW3_9EUKA|nr:hypothetical protein TRFO_16184 [Tritrichomonas foetus]|eukprot:OHT13632.1 hypothetical protein TRFO_16184 [Tritrichomonas foetus]
MNFLSQVILHTPYEDLSLPSIRLAMDLLKYPNPIKKSAKNLLSILIDKCPIYVPKEVDVTKMNRKANCCEVTSDPFPQRTPPPIRAISVSEVFGKNNFLQYENNWENWLLHISQNLVLCSNSPAIRACHPLMQISTSFEHQLFPLILISVWEISSEKDRNILSNHISTISQNSNTPIELLSIFCDAVEAMDRAGYMLFNNPEIAGRIAVRCENFFRAVRFYERSPSADDNIKCEMIRIHARLQRHESALGIFTLTKKAHRDTSILKELSIWNEARNQYSPHKNESDFIEYIQCCSKLEDWGEIMKYTERFKTLSTESKKSCGTYFGAASTFYNMKDIDLFLPYMSKSTPRHCLWQAIVNIHMGKLKTTRALIERGMKLNASNRAPFLSGNYEPALPSIENATFLEELKDVVDVRENPDMCDRILTLWNSKSAWVKSDVEQLRTLFVVRRLLESNDQPQIGFNFLDVARKLKAWEVYDNSIERFLDSCNDERVKLLKAKVRFDRRQTRDLDEIVDLIKTAADNDTYANAVCAYASRISNPTPELLEMLSTVIHKTPSFNRAWKHWAYGNLYCAQHFEDKKFAVNAMKGFTELIKLNGPYLHYLCQLVSLCFTYETNITDVFADLPPSSIEQIVSQLLSQFDHHNEAVSKSVIQIITKFAENNIQALGFPLSYVEKTGNISPNLADFINCIRKKHPQYMSEIDIVSNGLLEIAVLDIEMINYIIERTILKIDENCEKNVILKEINRMIPYTYKSRGRLKSIFDKKVENQTLANIKKFASEEQEFDARQLRNDLAFLDNQIIKELNKISTIDIAEIAPQMLENTPFSIAVPGMYKANNDGEFPVINSFTKIVKIIPSSKCPKKIRLYGSDGKIYKFLLKGKEDLRIDQRVMQWFSLSNSLLKDDKSGIEKDLSIEGYAVIPLSPLAGMIEWAEGGESFYKLISWYHQIKRPELFTEESNLYDEYAMIGKTHALKHGIINRLEFFRSLCEITNDDALREAIWVKSLCAETWFTQKTNFARSTGLMSIVGYIIGLGDRHPNNILFMNNTGHAVHIDFSECFEKSSKRIIWPEKVPFRLTRMMIKAMGVSGVEGDFKITAQFVMNLMRRNKSALLAFLDIFSKESKTGIYPENFAKVNDKLNGNEFEGENELSVEVQVDRLIAEATNEYNLSQMYIGWKPHW